MIKIPTDLTELLRGRTAKEALSSARALLSDQRRWCQHVVAMNIDMRPIEPPFEEFNALSAQSTEDPYQHSCKPLDAEAKRWSILGAVAVQCEYGIIPVEIIRYLDQLAEAYGFNDVNHLNDLSSHAAMLAFLEKAAEALE